jgi:hypothetical protein
MAQDAAAIAVQPAWSMRTSNLVDDEGQGELRAQHTLAHLRHPG